MNIIQEKESSNVQFEKRDVPLAWNQALDKMSPEQLAAADAALDFVTNKIEEFRRKNAEYAAKVLKK
jgi:hypothetical protein